ncbi:hypothetical protein JHN63_38510 [Streptomyces sp. MBT65]|uniref:hypothetical protein n=1 Tax=Streptomyces sp. MBT65 TaxID=1488395 RepID=UPI00190DC7A0|nr:hypothetical protein [Streptomyces sp. MBT65]MBK3579592.1 hypothetical protein [Streptomyces sp. MBT65]
MASIINAPPRTASCRARMSAPATAVQMIQVDTELVARTSGGVAPFRSYVARPSSSPKTTVAARTVAGASRRDVVVVAMPAYCT